MIGLLTLIAFIIGLSTSESNLPIVEVPDANGITTQFSQEEVKVEIGQTMAFMTLAFSELVHIFNIRNNKKSILKTKVFNNKKLLLAVSVSALLMFVILFIPTLRHLFSIPVLPIGNIIEVILLVFAPLLIVEIFKILKINTTKDEV